MKKPESPSLPEHGQFLVYPTEDGRTKIDVRLEDESVWLTQQHMAELFQTTQQNISFHLQNIYEEGELQREATHKEYLSVRQERSPPTSTQSFPRQKSPASYRVASLRTILLT